METYALCIQPIVSAKKEISLEHTHMLTEYWAVYEFPAGSGLGRVRWELSGENELRPVDQTPKALGEIIDYHVECDCGETFWTWNDATPHVKTDHADGTVGLPSKT